MDSIGKVALCLISQYLGAPTEKPLSPTLVMQLICVVSLLFQMNVFLQTEKVIGVTSFNVCKDASAYSTFFLIAKFIHEQQNEMR